MSYTFPPKIKVIASLVCLIVSFAAGRYSVAPPTIKTSVSTTENEQSVEAKNTHTKTTITETKKPDGTDVKVTVTDQVQNDDTKIKENMMQDVQQTITPPKKNTLNISILGSEDFSKGLSAPTYGLSVTKEVLGPVTVGGFALMSGVVGISIGLDF